MPAYEWVCLACGHDNAAEAAACSRCACPAQATVKQVAEYRTRHVATGGTLAPGVGSNEQTDSSGVLIGLWKLFSFVAKLLAILFLGART